MLKYFVSVKVTLEEYKHFEVPREVYTYIRQLESAIKTSPEGIKTLYPERFTS